MRLLHKFYFAINLLFINRRSKKYNLLIMNNKNCENLMKYLEKLKLYTIIILLLSIL